MAMVMFQNSVLMLLAGGQSQRFGREDKAVAMLAGQRLIDHALRFADGWPGEVVISGSSDYGSGYLNWPDDALGPQGPAAALWSFLHRCAAESCFTIPIDTPFLPDDLFAHFSQQVSAVACSSQRVHPAVGHWLRDDLARAFASLSWAGITAPSLHKLAEICSAEKIMFEDDAVFFNINTQADLAQAAQHIDRLNR